MFCYYIFSGFVQTDGGCARDGLVRRGDPRFARVLNERPSSCSSSVGCARARLIICLIIPLYLLFAII